MQNEWTTPEATPASRPGLGEPRWDLVAVACFCLIFAAVLAVPAIFNDPDTYWHIRTGDWVIAHHAIPTTDPFGFAAGVRHWFSHEWLSQVLLALAFRAGGWFGVWVLAAAAAGIAAAVLMRHLRIFLNDIDATVAWFLACCLGAPSMLARPHLLAWPCLAIWCAGLTVARAERRPPSWLLLPVMLVWVNLHGSFMAGLLLPFALAVEAWFDPEADRRRVAMGWGKFIAAAWAVALANPAFISGVLFPFNMLQMHSLSWIDEWTPSDFSHLDPLEVAILALLLLGFASPVRLPPIRLLLLVALVHSALAHGRNEQLLGIIGACLLAEPIGVGLARGRSSRPPRWLAPAGGVLAVAALVVRLFVPLDPIHANTRFAAAMAAVPSELRARPVLNDYGYGGRLIFLGIRPFVDGRADMYGDAFLTRYRQATMDGGEALAALLSDYAIDWTVFPANSRMSGFMDARPGWHRLEDRDGIAVYVRVDAVH